MVSFFISWTQFLKLQVLSSSFPSFMQSLYLHNCTSTKWSVYLADGGGLEVRVSVSDFRKPYMVGYSANFIKGHGLWSAFN